MRRKTFEHAAGIGLLALIFVAGCVGDKKEASGSGGAAGSSRLSATLRDLGTAPAALAVSEPMRPFFAAGLGLVLLAGLTICLGGRKTGFILIGLGAATTATGVLFVQYPWTVLLLTLAAGLVAVFAVLDRLRARREMQRNRETLEATTEIIQKLPEGKAIKAGLSELGEEKESVIRSVINPIKEKLKTQGRI